MKKKIGFIVPTLNAGGIENYLLRFLNFISKERYSVVVICKSTSYGDLEALYEKLQCEIIHQPLGYFNFKFIKSYIEILKKEKFDTIVDFTGNFAGIIMLLSNIYGVTNRITFYRRSTHAFRNRIHYKLYSKVVNILVYYNSTKILSNSEAAFIFFFKEKYKNKNNFKVIKNGVNEGVFSSNYDKVTLKEINNIPRDKIIIGHIGRYDTAKNHDTIFKVAQNINQENYHFVFCGSRTDSKDFYQKLQDFGITSMVTCLGIKDNIAEIMNTFDFFLFPSVTEGQPNALIEAIMCRLPILTSDINPIKEVVPELFHIKLINPKDHERFTREIVNENFIELNDEDFHIFCSKFNYKTRFKEFENEL